MDWRIEVPRELILELKNPSRKRTIKTILRENWQLIESIDLELKKIEKIPEDLPLVVSFALKNFMTIFGFLVNPRKLSIRKRKIKNEPEEILEFENDLREAQRNWNVFLEKYDVEISSFVNVARNKAAINFHENLWQKTRIQKITNVIAQISEKFQEKTVNWIPPSRFLFAFVGFLASWTVLPVFNAPKRLSEATNKFLENNNSTGTESVKNRVNGKQNGHEMSRPRELTSRQSSGSYLGEEDEALMKFRSDMENSEKLIAEREFKWNEKLSKFQKEVSARLEVQEKRLFAEIEQFEEEKEIQRQKEREEFNRRMDRQEAEFQTIVNRIDTERKKCSEEEFECLLESCHQQNESLLELFDACSLLKHSSFHWEEHEDYWSIQLQIFRNSLSLIRSEFWSFKRYLRSYLESPETNPNFLKVLYDMESASFGKTVTRAQTLISKQQEFYDILFDKYDDDLFLRVIWKITSEVSNQLDHLIVELWSVAVNPVDYDYYQLESAVLAIDPFSIPTAWRLKGICHSTEPSDYEDTFSLSSHSLSNGHF